MPFGVCSGAAVAPAEFEKNDLSEVFLKIVLHLIGGGSMAMRIVLTTTATVPNREIKEVVNIISAEVAVGMNIFKDMFSAVRDVVGGRAGSVQDTLRDLRNQALEELREEAARVGADAVVGVDLDYSEFSGGGRSMLFIVANGTAVRLK
jgi:uncharacterized protein YbjQ (UPF0145 family)